MKTVVARKWGAQVPALFLGVFLTACGFEPLYKDGSGHIAANLASIKLQSVTGAEEINFQLQKELAQFLPQTAQPDYTMYVSAVSRHRSTAVTSLANTIRFNYELDVTYTLEERSTGLSYRDSKSVITSYGVVVSQYSSRIGREVAEEKAAKEAAERIKFELIVFLRDKARADLEKTSEDPSQPRPSPAAASEKPVSGPDVRPDPDTSSDLGPVSGPIPNADLTPPLDIERITDN